MIGGRYLIEQVIGRGATGVVYRGQQMPLERPVAVKTIAQHVESQLDWVRRFRREARVMSRLSHPNSVQLIDFGHTSDGLVYLVMELLEGVDLFTFLQRRGPLPLSAAIDIATQALSALHEAHNKGIVHRDLKPSNVFMCRADWTQHHVKLIDFGLAKGTAVDGDSLTGRGTIVGTPQYMSPQQCMGQAVDHTTDLYAIGVLFFEMLAGKPPFDSKRPIELLAKHVTAPVPSIAAARPNLANAVAVQAAIDMLMAKQPGDRPTSAAEASGLLERLRDGASGPVAAGRSDRYAQLLETAPPDARDVGAGVASVSVHALDGSEVHPDEQTALAIPAMVDQREAPQVQALTASRADNSAEKRVERHRGHGPMSAELLELGAAAAKRRLGVLAPALRDQSLAEPQRVLGDKPAQSPTQAPATSSPPERSPGPPPPGRAPRQRAPVPAPRPATAGPTSAGVPVPDTPPPDAPPAEDAAPHRAYWQLVVARHRRTHRERCPGRSGWSPDERNWRGARPHRVATGAWPLAGERGRRASRFSRREGRDCTQRTVLVASAGLDRHDRSGAGR